MGNKISRRHVVKLAATGAMSAASLRVIAGMAQDAATSPYLFPNSSELSWVDPWQAVVAGDPYTQLLPDAVGLWSEKGEVLIGHFDTATTINDAANSFLAMVGEVSSAEAAGGGSNDGGINTEFKLYVASVNDGSLAGVYVQLVDSVGFIAFAAPVDEFGAEFTSAQSSIMVDGVGIFGGADGAGLQQSLEASVSRVAVPEGEYTDAGNHIHVWWTNGWTEVSRDDVGVEVMHPSGSIKMAIQVYEMTASWPEMAEEDTAWIRDDQGDNPMVLGPMVADDTFWVATDGQYGIRLLEGALVSDPSVYSMVFAHSIEDKGEEAELLFREAAASIRVNGHPAFRNLDQFEAEYIV